MPVPPSARSRHANGILIMHFTSRLYIHVDLTPNGLLYFVTDQVDATPFVWDAASLHPQAPHFSRYFIRGFSPPSREDQQRIGDFVLPPVDSSIQRYLVVTHVGCGDAPSAFAKIRFRPGQLPNELPNLSLLSMAMLKADGTETAGSKRPREEDNDKDCEGGEKRNDVDGDGYASDDVSSAGAESIDSEYVAKCNEMGDAMGAFFGRPQRRNFYQSKIVCRRRSKGDHYFTDTDAETFAVLAFERDCVFTALLRNSPRRVAPRHRDPPQLPNCTVTSLRTGLPGSVVTFRMILSTVPLKAGDTFVLEPSSLDRAKDEIGWYTQFLASRGEPPPEESIPVSSTVWPADEDVYYSIGARHHLPRKDASLYFPYTLLQVRACERLPNEKEVVAARTILPGTCFAYCGPYCISNSHDTTMMELTNGKCFRGANVVRYVNHYFGFAHHGNAEFRVVKYITDDNPIDVIFLVVTEEVKRGDVLVVQSYGDRYDCFLERIAMCRGYFLSKKEAQGVARALVDPLYKGTYATHIESGDIVGTRNDSGVVYHLVLDDDPEATAVSKEPLGKGPRAEDEKIRRRKANPYIRVAELKGPGYPVFDLSTADHANSWTVSKEDVILFVRTWDYESLNGGSAVRFTIRDTSLLTVPSVDVRFRLDVSACAKEHTLSQHVEPLTPPLSNLSATRGAQSQGSVKQHSSEGGVNDGGSSHAMRFLCMFCQQLLNANGIASHNASCGGPYRVFTSATANGESQMKIEQ